MFINRERERAEGDVEGGYFPFLLHWDIFLFLNFLLLVGVT